MTVANSESSPTSWRTILEGRGVDDLINEYEISSAVDRKARLEDFFKVCTPVSTPLGRHDRTATIATHADLVEAGRITVLKPAAPRAFEFDGAVVPEPEIQLIDLRNSTILPDQTVFAEGLYITDEIRHMSGSWFESGEGYELPFISDLERNTRSVRLSMPPGVVRLPDNSAYFLFQAVVGSVSFGHFIIDTLSQLIVFDHLKRSFGDRLVPVIVNDIEQPLHWPGMRWLFEGLVEKVAAVVHLRPGARLEVVRAYTSNRLAHFGAGGISSRAFRYLRSRIFAEFNVSNSQTPHKRVYVSRQDAGHRQAENIGDVERLLRFYGFQTVVIQDITPQAAFDALHDAEVIVGMHGSGLLYNIYMERPAIVIELSYPGFEWPIIRACATAWGHRTVRIECNKLNIDIDALEDVLRNLS